MASSSSFEVPFASVSSFQMLNLKPQKEVPLELSITELNPYITCGICMGYLYEASTITECMHTFCKSCIVRHTERKVTCPTCNSIIHPTEPLCNIKLDRTLQDIVWKLLPAVAKEERIRRDTFYAEWFKHHKKEKAWHGGQRSILYGVKKPKGKSLKKGKRPFMSSLKGKFKKPIKLLKPPRPRPPPLNIPLISLVLDCSGSSGTELENLYKKYVRVRSDAKISDIRKFLRRKLEINNRIGVDVFCEGEKLIDDITLAEIAMKLLLDLDDLLLLCYTLHPLPDTELSPELLIQPKRLNYSVETWEMGDSNKVLSG